MQCACLGSKVRRFLTLEVANEGTKATFTSDRPTMMVSLGRTRAISILFTSITLAMTTMLLGSRRPCVRCVDTPSWRGRSREAHSAYTFHRTAYQGICLLPLRGRIWWTAFLRDWTDFEGFADGGVSVLRPAASRKNNGRPGLHGRLIPTEALRKKQYGVICLRRWSSSSMLLSVALESGI